jgi:hypothetical protein
MVVLTSFNEPKTEKVTISKTTTEIGGEVKAGQSR